MSDRASGPAGAEGGGAMPSPAASGAPASAPAPAPAPAPESVLQTLQAMWHDLPGLVSDRVELLSLELHRAGIALAQIVMLLVACAILGITAWLLMWAGLVAGLMALGLHAAWALVVAVVINLAVAAWAVIHMRRLVRLLRLPATRRHLMTSTPSEPPVAAADSPTPHARPPSTPSRPQPATP